MSYEIPNSSYVNLSQTAAMVSMRITPKSPGGGGGVPLTAIELANSTLNKSYGDFLTITPRRNGRQHKPSHSDIGTNNSDQWQHHNGHGGTTADMPKLHLQEFNPAGIISHVHNGYRTNDTLCNADTMRLGSDSLHQRKQPKRSDTTVVSPVTAESTKLRKTPSHQHHLPDKLHTIIAYKNVSPPSAFSDTGKYSDCIGLKRDD